MSTDTDTDTEQREALTRFRRELVTVSAGHQRRADAWHESATTGEPDPATRDAWMASVMAASYAYTLAATLGIADREIGMEAAHSLRWHAEEILENGDFDDVNADVTEDPVDPIRKDTTP